MANRGVMGASVLEKKMHYPAMTARQLAFRWKISLKTLRRWRLDGEGPIWHKLFQHVRYHEADVLEFERVPRAVTHRPKPAVLERLTESPKAVLEHVMRQPWPNGWSDQMRVLAPPA